MENTRMSMTIDAFKVVTEALSKVKKRPPVAKIIAIDYDEEADILYVRFKHSKTVDNEPLDEDGLILASLNERNEVIGLTVMEASALA